MTVCDSAVYAAAAAGVTLSEWVKSSCRARLPEDPASSAVARARKLDPTAPCPHPRGARKVKPYGSWCEACGSRL